MSINLNKTKIVFSGQVNKEIIKCLNVLFATPVGSVVLDREFGIDWNILDQPINIAKARLTAESINKVRRYEPRVKVKSVTFEANPINGELIPTVRIENA